jgi:hypothetical protein
LNKSLSFAIILSVYLFPSIAYAYIEPGSGLMVIQVIIGIIAGGLVSIKLFWANIRNKLFGEKPSNNSDAEPPVSK